jgi:glycosyltransferase involved in cell wall biosynthesis
VRRVARNVLSSNRDVLFAIAGDGPEHDNLRALAERFGISDHIIWLGWQQDLTAFYHSLDLLLFNSDWDAMGRTPLEALSHGIPVVASVLHGGLTEIIDHQNYGPVFTSHDIDGLTDATCSILQHPKLAAHLVGVGRRRLQEVASVSGHADYVIGLLSGGGGQKRTGTG